MAHSSGNAAGSASNSFRTIAAASIGNALEWYDIVVYSFFAVYIAQVFFPGGDTTALVLALTTFAVSFLIRPLGAFILGSYADRVGRKPALSLTIMLMFVGSLLIVVMPSYAAIGVLAPIGILLARLIQGFSAGGEFGSATALMVENVSHRPGYAASWQFTSQAMATLLAASIGTFLTSTLTNEQLLSWGFRIPFVVGLLVGPVGLYIRRKVPETPEYRQPSERAALATSGWETVRKHKMRIILIVGVLAVTTSLNYMISYIPTYAINTLGLPGSVGFAATLMSGVVLLLCTPFAGHFSDRLGQIRLMWPAALLILLLIYPMFAFLVAYPGLGLLLGVVFVMSVLKAFYYGPMGAVMSKMFPTSSRATGMALGYNIGVAIFGGFTPLIATLLINRTGMDVAPSFWIIVAAIASLVSLSVIWRKLKLR